jgi:hypothetical protein
MNLERQFQPSQLTRAEDAAKVAATASFVFALKAATAEAKLSPEELELAAKLADEDSTDELAKILLNGELVRVGNTWLPGMRDKWIKAGNFVAD